MTKTPKLFISFTGTLEALARGRVDVDDLSVGLFVFGCTRNHAFFPGAHGEPVESWVSLYPDAHRDLVLAVAKAEIDGRVRWRQLGDFYPSFELVNSVLTGNGFRPLMSDTEYAANFPGEDPFDYSYGSVERRSTELEVVYSSRSRSGLPVRVGSSYKKRTKQEIRIEMSRFLNAVERAGLEHFRYEAGDFVFPLRAARHSGLIAISDDAEHVVMVPREPEKVKRIVELARQHAPSLFYGWHTALLGLVTKRSFIGSTDGRVTFYGWAETSAYHEPGQWISLAAWLNDNGQKPDFLSEMPQGDLPGSVNMIAVD